MFTQAALLPTLFLSPFASRSTSQCSFCLHSLIDSVMIGCEISLAFGMLQFAPLSALFGSIIGPRRSLS